MNHSRSTCPTATRANPAAEAVPERATPPRSSRVASLGVLVLYYASSARVLEPMHRSGKSENAAIRLSACQVSIGLLEPGRDLGLEPGRVFAPRSRTCHPASWLRSRLVGGEVGRFPSWNIHSSTASVVGATNGETPRLGTEGRGEPAGGLPGTPRGTGEPAAVVDDLVVLGPLRVPDLASV